VKAAIYARYSTENQSEDSIADQFRQAERKADAEGLQIVARYEDRAISGGTAERPGYQCMLDDARAGKFAIIVAEDISRLWRSRAEYGARSAELEDLGVNLLTLVGDDTRREGWGLVLGIKQAISEHARKEISYRTKRGLEGLALAHRPTGGVTYGYTKANEIVPEEAEIVRKIFMWCTWGDTTRVIVAKLAAMDAPRPKYRQGHKHWHWKHEAVAYILRNSKYVGDVVYGRTEMKISAQNSAVRRQIDRAEPLVRYHDESLRIIDQELWDRAQAALDSRIMKCAPRRTK
jgi:DNA invertase Pin-like site-specific DNA recombinase